MTIPPPALFRYDEPDDSVRFGPGDKHGQVQALAECPQRELAYVPLAALEGAALAAVFQENPLKSPKQSNATSQTLPANFSTSSQTGRRTGG